MSRFTSLLELVLARADSHADRPLYAFVPDDPGGQVAEPVFADLVLRARRLAGEVQRHAEPGDRVLLLLPTGERVIVGLLACILAGVACVPLPAGDHRRASFVAQARDAGARLVISDPETRARLQDMAPGLRWLAVDDAHDAPWTPPPTGPDDLAWLQYTSGSTGTPRGVIVRHRNALANSADIAAAWQFTPSSHALSWVPHYHDDGLVNGILQPLYTGCRATLMSPFAFIQRPLRWLRLIGERAISHTGGPNFGYEVCLRKVSPAETEGLDLSSWTVAYNAAEPIRAATVRRFFAAFAACGLRWSALRPAYGMAETTLLVTTSDAAAGPVIAEFDADALRLHGRAVPAAGGVACVSSGRVVASSRLAIADEHGAPRPEGAIGEILVAGPGVTCGHWQRPPDDTFSPLAGGPWLRTGDLGFLQAGELFVTGRRKDLIIVAGANYYPQDVEAAIEACDPAFRPGCCAAVAIDLGDASEGLAVIAEVLGPEDPARLAERAQAALGLALGLRLDRLVLLPRETLPKTTSGKVRRQVARAALLADELPALTEWRRELAPPQPHHAPAPPHHAHHAPAPPQPHHAPAASHHAHHAPAPPQPHHAPASPPPHHEPPPHGPAAPAPTADLRAAITATLARQLGVAPSSIASDAPFIALGLRSLDAAEIAAALTTATGRLVGPLLLFRHFTVDALARHLSAGTDVPVPADSPRAGQPIAIVGLAVRLPGDLDEPAAYWDLLAAGRDAVTPVPADRWRLWQEQDPDIESNPRLGLRTGGFRGGLDRLDAGFFAISPREAQKLDPQQRWALELCWEALEDAGIPPDSLAGSRTGVWVGALNNENFLRVFSREAMIDAHSGTSSENAILANRLSYLLDLRGPSLTLDTACSSSLVALHLAVESLRRGETDLAIVAGVNLLLTPGATIMFSQTGALSRSGRSRPFDAAADGFVRSEGAAVVVVKTLERALADDDRVHAVVRGTAVVQDGRTNGIMAPNQAAQVATVRAALADAGLDPSAITLVEAHGTGTPLGDPIEAAALGEVFAPGRLRPLWIGSAKANLGHLEGTAGLAGLIKTVLSLECCAVPPLAHWQAPNPLIPLEALRLAVPTTLTPWVGPRFAGVSSFGFGGTNAHVVLAAAPDSHAHVPLTDAAHAAHTDTTTPRADTTPTTHTDATAARADATPPRADTTPTTHTDATAARADAPPPQPHYILPLSARSPAALAELATRWRARLTAPGASVRDLCHTAAVRRAHHPWRVAAVGADAATLAAALAELPTAATTPPSPALLLCSGHGSQSTGMSELPLPAYREALAAALHAIREFTDLPWPLTEPDLDSVARVQPAIFAAQVALAATWTAMGLPFAGALGHSMGEVAAAHIAGALTLRDAARVIVARSRLLATVEGRGAMLAVPIAPHELGLGGLAVAVDPGPSACVVAGDPAEVAALEARLAARSIATRRVRTAVAFHTPQMDPLMQPLREALRGLAPRRADHPLWSTVTGERVDGAELGPDYWAANLRAPVRLGPALRAALAATPSAPVAELAPHPLLAGSVRGLTTYLPAPQRHDPPLAWPADLYRRGLPLRWRAVCPEGQLTAAPTYPWQRERHWADVPPRPARTGHPLLGAHPPLTPGETRRWSQDLAPHAWLADHRLGEAVLLPASLTLELALAAGHAALPGPLELQDVVFTAPYLPEAPPWPLELSLTATTTTTAELLASAPSGPLTRGRLAPAEPPPAIPAVTCPEPRDLRTFYADLRRRGLAYGPAFRAITHLSSGPGEARAELTAPEALGNLAGTAAHPALLDAAFHTAAAAVPLTGTVLPVGVRRLCVLAPLRGRCTVLTRAEQTPTGALADLWLVDEQNTLLVAVVGLELRRLSLHAADDRLYELAWRPCPPTPTPTPVRLLPDSGPLATRLAALLHQHGATVSPTATTLVDLRPLALDDHDHDALAASLAELAPTTRDARRLVTVVRDASTAGAAIAGAVRCVRRELPDLRATCLHLAGDAPLAELARAILGSDDREEARITAAGRDVRRLVRARVTPATRPLTGPVLISGGLGALGLLAAEELARRGAPALHLVARAAPSPAQAARLAALPCPVRTIQADITDLPALRAALAGVDLHGVVHTAGVVDDAPLADLTAARAARVLAPKLAGALALDRLAPNAAFFVLYGSIAGLWGNPGQTAYAAANAALAAFAAWRRARGRPALCLDWGPWSGAGMAARAGVLERAAATGLPPIAPDDGAALLGQLLHVDAAHLAVAPIDWPRLASDDPLLADFVARPAAPAAADAAVIAAVQAAFGVADLDLDVSIAALGLDSLIALDLRTRLRLATGVELPIQDLLRGPTPRDLISRTTASLEIPDVDAMSDAEVERLLAEMAAQDPT